MTYDEALAFWYGRVNFERKSPQPGDLKLDRMRALLHELGDPHEKLRTIHVAGSKGKGSTCAMLASILQHAGYRTGLFTSPHLCDVRERIQVNCELIHRDQLAELMETIKPAVDRLETHGEAPTFFEVGTAIGLLHFLRQECDFAIIEVGLGGRFDSTNVLTPLVSVITSISLDHTQMLGETVEEIAFEKAGIIKPGVPVVSGVTDTGPRDVIARIARDRGAPLIQLGVDIHVIRDLPVEARIRLADEEITLHPRLPGRHQVTNAALAAATIEQLRVKGFKIPTRAVIDGIARVDWPARFEVIPSRPLAVLDCAHNVASVKALVDTLDQLAAELPSERRLIFAASADKDIPGMFAVLVPHFQKFFLTRYQQSTRAVSPERLSELLPTSVERSLHPTPADAWQAARETATAKSLVVVAGSVFLAGEIRPILIQASSPVVAASA